MAGGAEGAFGLMLAAAFFLCTVAAVSDGDTFRCSDGTRVRLQAIDAPEMGKCRRGRICAPGNPHKAKAALSHLALGKTLRCQRTGKSYERVTAWCTSGRIDLSCAMVRAGYAVRVAKYDRRQELCRR